MKFKERSCCGSVRCQAMGSIPFDRKEWIAKRVMEELDRLETSDVHCADLGNVLVVLGIRLLTPNRLSREWVNLFSGIFLTYFDFQRDLTLDSVEDVLCASLQRALKEHALRHEEGRQERRKD